MKGSFVDEKLSFLLLLFFIIIIIIAIILVTIFIIRYLCPNDVVVVSVVTIFCIIGIYSFMVRY